MAGPARAKAWSGHTSVRGVRRGRAAPTRPQTPFTGVYQVWTPRPEPWGSRENGLFPPVPTPHSSPPHVTLPAEIDSVLTGSVCTQTGRRNSPAAGARRQLDLRPRLQERRLPKRTSPAAAPSAPGRTAPGRRRKEEALREAGIHQ